MIQIRQEFANKRLAAGTDPELWFVELAYCCDRLQTMGTDIDDDEYIAHVMCNLPPEYEATLAVLEMLLKRNELTARNLEETICAKWDSSKKTNKEEIALVSKFKGNCNYCGKQGHKENQCHKKKREIAERTSKPNKVPVRQTVYTTERPKTPYHPGLCPICKKVGHKPDDCWFKGKSNESANVAHEKDDQSEFGMTMCENDICMPTQRQSDWMWFADSAATSHMKPTMDGMSNLTKTDGKIKIGDGKYVSATHIGTFTGFIPSTNENGKEEEQMIVLNNVLVVPDLWCNLFSVLHAMKKGALISNNKTSMTISKYPMVFEILIN